MNSSKDSKEDPEQVNIEDILQEEWKKVLAEKFVHPRLDKKPQLVLDPNMDTACINFADLSTKVNS